MSHIFNYFKNLFHPTSIQDRKRRRSEFASEAQQPKYQRVSSVFPKQYKRHDDDTDHFQQVRRNRNNYNDILESFLMEQQDQHRKQFRKINDEEFSDEEDLSAIRVPSLNNRRSQLAHDGYNFSSTKQSSSRSFAQNKNSRELKDFPTSSRKAVPMLRPNVPELVPIKRSTQPHQFTNGYQMNEIGFNRVFEFPRKNRVRSNENTNSSSQDRLRYDFTAKNRAFNDTSNAQKSSNSVLDRNHNLDLKIKYDNLIKSLIPRCAQKDPHNHSNGLQLETLPENIPALDISSDEAETNGGAAAAAEVYPTNRFFQPRHKKNLNFKTPTSYVDLSEDDDPIFRGSVFSSTLIQKRRGEGYKPESSHKKSELSSFQSVAPVNSLKDRQQSLNCLQENAITSIIQKYHEFQKQKDSQIQDATQTVAKLSSETAEHEKQQQRRIDETVTSLKQCIILDEEDEVIDEFPPLTDKQLQIVRFGLEGPRGEVIVSKFSQNISRLDLITLDGLNWLNDEIINFYMELIKLRSEEVDHLPKVHVMNTFFLGKLMQMGHPGVRRWTRKIDIFSYDIIPVPVHVGGVHWCMSIIHMREKSIKYYDSMGHPNMTILNALNVYLQEESMDKRKIPFDTRDWTIECVKDCPQQRNGSDCGVFSCMFAEFICRGSNISFDQQHMPYFRRKMVYEIATGKLLLGY